MSFWNFNDVVVSDLGDDGEYDSTVLWPVTERKMGEENTTYFVRKLYLCVESLETVESVDTT